MGLEEGAGRCELRDVEDLTLGVHEEYASLALVEPDVLGGRTVLGCEQADDRLVVEGHDERGVRSERPEEFLVLLDGRVDRLCAEERRVRGQDGQDLGDALTLALLEVGVKAGVLGSFGCGCLFHRDGEGEAGVGRDLAGAGHEEGGQERPGEGAAGVRRGAELLLEAGNERPPCGRGLLSELHALGGEGAGLVRSVLDRLGMPTADHDAGGALGDLELLHGVPPCLFLFISQYIWEWTIWKACLNI